MSFFYGANADFDPVTEALPGTRDIRTLEVGARLLREFRVGVDKQDGTTRPRFKTGDILMPASDMFPRIKDQIPLKPRSGEKTKKTLEERVAALVGFSFKDKRGTTYTVGTISGRVTVKVAAVGGAAVAVTPASPDWKRIALMVVNTYAAQGALKSKPQGKFKPSASSGTSSGGGTGDQTGGQTGDQTGGQTGDQTGGQTAAWTNQPYLSQVAALSGFTGPSATTPGVSYTVKMIDLTGVQAPAIDVTAGGGATGGTGTTDTITPESSTWVAAALEVLAAKSNVDTGIAAPGSTTPGTTTVTSEQTGSGGSVWSSEGVPSSDVLADQAQQTVDAALSEGAGGGAMTVSGGGAAASGESMFGKYKWLILGGVGVAVAVYGNKQGWFK